MGIRCNVCQDYIKYIVAPFLMFHIFLRRLSFMFQSFEILQCVLNYIWGSVHWSWWDVTCHFYFSDEALDQQPEDSLEVVFESSQKRSESCETSSDKSDMYTTTTTTTTKEVCKYKKFEYNEEPSNLPEWAVLYIQMQLCHQTLRQWLDVRNVESCDINLNTCIDIFTKVVKGVEYIHSKGIVHHDIKVRLNLL